ncbi:MAG: hypothetical protein ACUVUC_07000 [Thermoguttaceae bacterium]
MHAVASDFVACPGGMVARVVRHVNQTVYPDKPWFVGEWVSEDLGKRLPTDADFVITIPQSVRISGLKPDRTPRPGTVRTIDLSKISLDDLDEAYLTPEQRERLLVGRPRTRRWLLWIAGVGGTVALVIVVFLAGRRRMGASRSA